MKLLAVVTLPYIYHGCSTQKKFWEENLTPVNMKNCGHRNVRKHRYIKNVEKYIVKDAALGGTWMSRTPRQVSRTGVDGITPVVIENAIGIVEKSSPALIEINWNFPILWPQLQPVGWQYMAIHFPRLGQTITKTLRCCWRKVLR